MSEEIDILKIIPNPLNEIIYGKPDNSLSEDIKEHGILVPIVINQDDKIISGHRRYYGALDAKLKFVQCDKIITTNENETTLLISHNKQRVKTPTQIHLESKYLIANKNTLSYNAKQETGDGVIDNVAATLGVSKGHLHRINRVIDAADTGDAFAITLQDKLDNGEMTPGQAYKKFRAKENERRLKTIVCESTNDIINEQILHGDFKEVLEYIPDGSVSLILTDPPYPHQYISLFGEIAQFAERKLCEGGYLVCYSGEMYLPEVFEELCKTQTLKYYWTFCLFHESSSQLVMTTNIQCGWKPVIVLQKLPSDRKQIKLLESHKDVVISDVREKTDHAWQQSTSGVMRFMEIFSSENDLVVDTCVGAGTTAIAAHNLKRRFVGAEIDKNTANIARARLVALFDGV